MATALVAQSFENASIYSMVFTREMFYGIHDTQQKARIACLYDQHNI